MGVPLTGNFIGEFLSLLGAFQQNIFIASIGATSVILSAVYSIFMYNRITGGALSPFVHTIPDIFRKEFYIILPLLVLTLLLGIYPCFISYDVEFGLSNYLLFTFFPAVLMDNSEKAETSNNSSNENSDNDELYFQRDRIIHIEAIDPNVSESTTNSSSDSEIAPNSTLDPQEREATSSDNESNGPDDIYFNIEPNEESTSDSEKSDDDSVKEAKSVNGESEDSESESVKSDSDDDHGNEE